MTVRGALRAALRDLYEQSWRLLVLNVVVAVVAVAAAIVIVVSYAPASHPCPVPRDARPVFSIASDGAVLAVVFERPAAR